MSCHFLNCNLKPRFPIKESCLQTDASQQLLDRNLTFCPPLDFLEQPPSYCTRVTEGQTALRWNARVFSHVSFYIDSIFSITPPIGVVIVAPPPSRGTDAITAFTSGDSTCRAVCSPLNVIQPELPGVPCKFGPGMLCILGCGRAQQMCRMHKVQQKAVKQTKESLGRQTRSALFGQITMLGVLPFFLK